MSAVVGKVRIGRPGRMGRIGRWGLWVALLSMGLSLPAAAQELTPEERPYGHRRYYLGLGGMGGFPVDSDFDLQPGGAIWVRGGGRIFTRFSVELQGEFQPGYAGDDGASVWAWGVTGNAKYYFTRTSRQPFAMFGVGGMRQTVSGIGNAIHNVGPYIRVGGGMDWYWREDRAINFEGFYGMTFGDLTDFKYIGLAITLQMY